MHMAAFGFAVSAIMTIPHFALIIEITPLRNYCLDWHPGSFALCALMDLHSKNVK